MLINIEDPECKQNIADLLANYFQNNLLGEIHLVDNELNVSTLDGKRSKLKLPLRLSELKNTLQNLWAQKQVDIIHISKELSLHISARVLSGAGSNVQLTEKETSLLAFLANQAEPISKELLLSEVWQYQSGIDTHTLETHLSRLRSKLLEANIRLTLVSDAGGLKLSTH